MWAVGIERGESRRAAAAARYSTRGATVPPGATVRAGTVRELGLRGRERAGRGAFVYGRARGKVFPS
jgi:hypothetical protein